MRSPIPDLRHAARSIIRSPLFAIVVIALLALGIGANTLIFTAVNALLLRPLPVAHPEEIVRLGVQTSPTHVTYDHPYLYCRTLRQAKSFRDVFVSWPLEMAVASGSRLESITGETVSGNYFAALGLKAERGRLLTIEDEQSDAPLVVIGHGFWQRAYAGRDPIGSTLLLRGSPFTVVGVMDAAFVGVDLETRSDVWLTMSAGKLWSTKPDNSRASAMIFMRLRGGVSPSQAEAEVRTLYPAMVEEDYSGIPRARRVIIEADKTRTVLLWSAERGVSAMRKTFTGAVIALMSAVVALLLLVCANIGGLIVARGETQRREIAILLSLGATRWTVVRRTLTEALMLSMAGAATGVMIARWCGPLLLRFFPQRRPLGIQLIPDIRVLAFAALACVLTALLLAALPAWHAGRINPSILLSRVSTRTSGKRLSRSLVAFQVAVSTVLAIGGLSLVRTLETIRAQDPGFRREKLIVMTVNPRMAGIKSAQIPQTFQEIARRAEALPGVETVSLAEMGLMRGLGLKGTIAPAGSRMTFADALNVSMNYVSPRHLENMNIRVVQGRGFLPGDEETKPVPTIVSASFAHKFFPGVTAIGKTFGSARPGGVAPPSNEIIGIVNDTRYRTMREIPPPTYYELLNDDVVKYGNGLVLHVGTRGEPGAVIKRLREMLAGIGNGLAPTDAATMAQEIETSLWQERLLAALAAAFATLSTLLAGLGLFGMLAHSVSQRTREIGIRMALGATTKRVIDLFVRDAARPVAPGLLLGLAMYAASARAIKALLFGITPWDALSIGGAAAGVVIIAVVATFFPAMRAASIQPSQALRDE